MVDAAHQLVAVDATEVFVVGAFDTEEIALFFVGHAEHEAGEFLEGTLAADLLLCDEAALIEALVEDDELLHLVVFGQGDVQSDFVVTVFLDHAFGEESLPLSGSAFWEEL